MVSLFIGGESPSDLLDKMAVGKRWCLILFLMEDFLASQGYKQRNFSAIDEVYGSDRDALI